MIDSKAEIYWSASKHTIRAVAAGSLSFGEIPPKFVLNSGSSIDLYWRLGQPECGLGGFGNPPHPLFSGKVTEDGFLKTNYWEFFDPIHQAAARFITSLPNSSARERAMDQLINIERLASYMVEKRISVMYQKLSSGYMIDVIDFKYP